MIRIPSLRCTRSVVLGYSGGRSRSWRFASDTAKINRALHTRTDQIVLVRHGESTGNVDEKSYVNTADWLVPLTKRGREQGRLAGQEINRLLSHRNNGRSKVFFYVSPYLRARQTLKEILCEVDPKCVVGIREDPRIAEQQFGNFQSHATIQDNKAARTEFGRFFYRFPDGGESGFDVYNRVSGFIGTMQRESEESWAGNGTAVELPDDGMVVCIVTHGLTLRLFLMRYFQYTVHEFERSYNPKNGQVITMRSRSCEHEDGGFEIKEVDRISMGFPIYKLQERFRLMHDYSLLDKSEW